MWSFPTTADYLALAAAPVNTAPCTLACWFQINPLPSLPSTLISIADAGAVTNQLVLLVYNTGVFLRVRAWVGGFAAANSTTNFLHSELHHAAAVFESSTMRRIYFDGIEEGTNTFSVTPAGADSTRIGRRQIETWNIKGNIGEAGIWSAALSPDEILSLVQGVPCQRIRTKSLGLFYPLRGPVGLFANNYAGSGLAMTVAGAPALAPLLRPTLGPHWGFDDPAYPIMPDISSRVCYEGLSVTQAVQHRGVSSG